MGPAMVRVETPPNNRLQRTALLPAAESQRETDFVMSDEIELHDSALVVELRGDRVVLRLCPAYVHHWERSPAGAGGWLLIGTHRYENLIPVPLEPKRGSRGSFS